MCSALRESELNPTDIGDFENSSFKEYKWVDILVGNEKTTVWVLPLTKESIHDSAALRIPKETRRRSRRMS